MKIRYLSDIHLEFWKEGEYPKLENLGEDVLILAGDIGSPYKKNFDSFFKEISGKWKKIFYITGNHEYYSKSVEEVNQKLEEYFSTLEVSVTFLNNSSEKYMGYNFVGTTLWSKIYLKEYLVNDFHQINSLTIQKYNQLYQESVRFLENEISGNEKNIIITHHGPSFDLSHPKYKQSPYNQCFYSDLSDLFSPKIKAWFYGHTHTPSQQQIKGVPFFCNPGENDEVNYQVNTIIK